MPGISLLSGDAARGDPVTQQQRENEWWEQFEMPATCRIVPMMVEGTGLFKHLQNDDCIHLGCERSDGVTE